MRGMQIVDDGSLHNYRTEIPNTIIRGTKSRTLSVNAKWLYVYLKCIAGDKGQCHQSLATISASSGMSRSEVSKSRRELQGAHLIRIVPGKRPNRDNSMVRIVDIWPQNMQEFSVSYRNTDDEGNSHDKYNDNNDLEGNFSSGVSIGNTKNGSGVSIGNSGVSHMDTKKISLKKKEKKEQDPDPSQRKKNARSPIERKKKETPALRSHFVPADFVLTETMRSWAQEHFPDVDVNAATEEMRDHEYAKPHSDWSKAWRNWIRRTPHYSSNGHSVGMKHKNAHEGHRIAKYPSGKYCHDCKREVSDRELVP